MPVRERIVRVVHRGFTAGCRGAEVDGDELRRIGTMELVGEERTVDLEGRWAAMIRLLVRVNTGEAN